MIDFNLLETLVAGLIIFELIKLSTSILYKLCKLYKKYFVDGYTKRVLKYEDDEYKPQEYPDYT